MALIDTITQLGTTIINFTSAKITGALDALTEYITDNTSGESGDIGGGSSVDIMDFVNNTPVDTLETTNKTIVGSINELKELSGGSSDYATLTNKPQIGGVELAGNKTLAELGIQAAGDYITGNTLTDYALKTELAAKQDTLTAGTNINITENVIKEFVPIVELSSSAGTKNLETNSVYSLSAPAGTVTFSLPTPADNTEFNQILVQLSMTTVRTINVGTSYFFNKTAPDLSSAGVYDLVWEYDKANGYWVCGLLSKGIA